MSYLEISPDFSAYNELLQRTVVYVLCHADEELAVGGVPLYELATKGTTSALQAAQRRLGSMAKAVKQALNEDVAEDDTHNIIQNLEMSLEATNTTNFKFIINIQTAASDIVTGALTINGKSV